MDLGIDYASEAFKYRAELSKLGLITLSPNHAKDESAVCFRMGWLELRLGQVLVSARARYLDP